MSGTNGKNGRVDSAFGIALLNIMERSADGGSISVSLVGCGPGDGATTIVQHLVSGVRTAGRKVAFLDLSLTQGFNPGRLDVESVGLEEVVRANGGGPIACPSCGFLWINARGVEKDRVLSLGRQEIGKLLWRLRERFNLVVVEGPPLLTHNLGEIIALCVDQCYIVVRERSTTHFQVQHVLDRFGHLNIEPAGFVFNDRSYPIPRMLYQMLFGARARR